MTHEWRTIDSAPRDGAVFIGVSLEPDKEWPERRMKWGVAGRPEDNYLCNGGQPWWINPEARHLEPAPTHWRPDDSEMG